MSSFGDLFKDEIDDIHNIGRDNLNRKCRVCEGKGKFSFSIEPSVSLICGNCINNINESKKHLNTVCLVCDKNPMGSNSLVCYRCENNLTSVKCKNKKCDKEMPVFNKMCNECWESRHNENMKKEENQDAVNYFIRHVKEKERRERMIKKKNLEREGRERRREEIKSGVKKLMNDMISIVDEYIASRPRDDNIDKELRYDLEKFIDSGELSTHELKSMLLSDDGHTYLMYPLGMHKILNKWKERIISSATE